jgi:hypothetical protein
MNKFIRYITFSNSSKICCMAKGAKTFTTMDSHFVWPHENFSSCNLLITEDLQSMDQKEWMCFIVWNAQSFFGYNMFTLINYSFFGKIRCYFLLQLLVSVAFACFLFLISCSISEWPPRSIENCDLQMEPSTFPICWSSFKNGTVLLNSQ